MVVNYIQITNYQKGLSYNNMEIDIMNHTGTSTNTMIYSERARKRAKRKAKAFNKRYARECGECITRMATKEELIKYFGE